MSGKSHITNEHLNEIVDMVKGRVEEQISEGTKVVEPFLVICGVDKKNYEFDVMYADLSSAMPEDSEIKQAIFASLGHACIKQKFIPFLVVIVSEAWMVAVDQKEFASGKTVRPSKHKDRIEIVDVTALSSDKRTCSFIYIVGRDDENNLTIVDTEEFKFGDEGEHVTATLLESFFAGCSMGLEDKDDIYPIVRTIKGMSDITKDLLN